MIGGIALIAGGMLFGDIFAVFVLHQNGGATGQALLAASHAVAAGDAQAVKDIFGHIGGLLEDHGTKLDTHVHMSDAGYLALLLALVQPYVALSEKRKRQLAWLFLVGGILLPTGIFLIHYVGLAYSPSPVIGWASVLADSAGGLLIAVLVIESWALCTHFKSNHALSEPAFTPDRKWEQKVLLSGGATLVLLGFVYGAWYAGVDLYEHEARETRILHSLLRTASQSGDPAADVTNYGSLAAEKAVKVAAHSHIIEFGLLAMLLSFIQPYVYLSPIWRRRWIVLLLAGSLVLPVFVLLEVHLGLPAGGIADTGGLMVVIALMGMLAGVIRYTGALEAMETIQP
jgi:hypothetical protein